MFYSHQLLFSGLCIDVNCIKLGSRHLKLMQDTGLPIPQLSNRITANNITSGLQPVIQQVSMH